MSDPDLKGEGYAGPPPDSPVENIPTHQAAASNDVAVLADLVHEGSPLLGTETKETPLHAAAKKGAVDTLKWLLDNKTVSPLEKASNGNSAAHYAAVYGYMEALKLLIEHDPELSKQVVSQVDESGLSLISLATLQGDKTMTEWLIDHYPDVGDIPNINGDLAVHFAAAQGNLAILKLLVRQYGKDILERQDKNMTKPVYFASQEGRLTVLDYLINELGVDPVAREKSGISTVHAAVQAGRYKAVKWLITKLGPKYILDKTIDGATPLHMAAAQGHTDILRYLLDNLENRTDVNVLDHIHATPAHDAAEYGQVESMLLLLRNGADITIKDTENKTPYELAVEQSHPDVAAMIADLRDNGPSALNKYDKKKRSSSQPVPMIHPPRTSQTEAEELSAAIKQSTDIQEHRKNKQLQRQESLQRMNERGLEEDDKKKANSDEDEIEHTLGPNGDIYARPKRRKHKNPRPQGSDEDLLNDATATNRQKNSLLDAVLPLDDSTYASVNHETASNYSRPSRVRRYQDSDSEITSISSQYKDGRHNIPGFCPPYAAGYYPPLPPPRKGQHSSASSLHSSKTGQSKRQGHPHMMPYGTPYGYYPMPYTPYGYPYPHYGAGYRPKTTEERMHLAALQQGQMAGHMMPGHPVYYYNQPLRGRRSKLKKRSRSRQPSRDPSPPGVPRKHTDADMGYGPPVQSINKVGVVRDKLGGVTGNQSGFHPHAPPITTPDGTSTQAGDTVVNFDSNFIMMKKSDTNEDIKQLGGTTLNLAKAPKHYDGRWDSYIMTDSESEREVDESYCVAFAAETAAIVAIGCVSGLRGLRKLRKATQDATQQDKAYLSSAWDEPPMPTKGHSRRGSISGLADPTLKDVTPEDFAAREEMSQQVGWSVGSVKKTKKKKHKKGAKEDMYRSTSAETLDKEPQSELLAGELEKQRTASVSRSFGQKMLFDALGARESSMLNIASASLAGSMMSLDPSADEGKDEFDDETINLVHGIKMEKPKRKKSGKNHETHPTDPDNVVSEMSVEAGGRSRSGRQSEKQRAKEEERAKRAREKEMKRQEKKNAKRDRQKKKEEQRHASKELSDQSGRETTAEVTPKRPTSGKKPSQAKKPSPPIPVRSAPHLPKPSSTAAAVEVPQGSKKSPPTQQSRRPAPAPPLHKHTEQQRPAAMSTPVSSNGVTPKKNRKEKAQLKSSPTQPIRSTVPPSKQSSRMLEREARRTTTSPLGGTKPLEDQMKRPTQRKNTYFDDESDEEVEMAKAAKSGQKNLASKPPKAKKKGEPGMSELDNVLAQLEDIQSGGLSSWFETANVDKSEEEDSEDSLPLIVPTTTDHAPSETKPRLPTSNSRAQEPPAKAGPLTSDKSEAVTSTKGSAGSPSLPRFGEGGGRNRPSDTSWMDGDEATGILTGLERTKHGSPHPRRAIRKAGRDKEQRSAFEQRVMSTLEALMESMNQLKGNPSITQTEITEQKQLQQQLIQNLITYSQHDTQVADKLLSLLTDKNQDGLETSSSGQLEQLQETLLGVQERTYQETQERLQRAMQHTLEEKSQQQLKEMQAMFVKLMEEQEQRKRFEEEQKQRNMEEEEEDEEKDEEEVKEKKKKRKKGKDHSRKKEHHKKKKKRSHRSEESESGSSGSEVDDEGMVSDKTLGMPAVKTMEAKIFTQELLTEYPATPKQGKGRMRRTSDVELFRTTEALSRNLQLSEALEDEEEDEEMYFQHARPVTIRRADIKVQNQDDYTPQRPRGGSDALEVKGQPHHIHMEVASTRPLPTDEEHFDDFHMLKKRPPKQFEKPEKNPEFDEKNLRYGKQHIDLGERPKPVWREDDPLAGAGGELAAALRLRQKQMKNRERK